MGALTTKSFPYEVRRWDLEKFDSFDPTDSFGSNTGVYVNKNKICLIEPEFNNTSYSIWLTDKGRQFFDGIFGLWNTSNSKDCKNESWVNILNAVIKNVYLFDHCNQQQSIKKLMLIVFENLSSEVLNFLLILAQNYSFIKLRRAENFKIDNDLETTFQLNIVYNRIRLNSSTLCLLVSNNPRYEGSYLNLNLRQRFLKGNFKCVAVGSLIDLTFPLYILGSNIQILKSIAEGNNLFCQNLKLAKNPLLIYNNDILKRTDGNYIYPMFKVLNYSSTLNITWNGLNMLSSTLSETGNHSLTSFLPLTLKDLNDFSLLYFINVNSINVINIQKITKLKLLKYSLENNISIKKLILDQNYKDNNNYNLFPKLNLNSYFHLPTNTFYENEETFINTEGFIKRTTKLIFRKKGKSSWQILRKFINDLKNKIIALNNKDNELIFFNSNKLMSLKNYINFQYYVVQSLTHLNFYLTVKTNPIKFNKTSLNFKANKKMLQTTKLKYWLDDFYINGKDEYSHSSLILTTCSKLVRAKSTNFF